MELQDYDRYRILRFIHKANMITRAKLTSEGLARFPKFNMQGLYKEIDAMEDAGWIRHFRQHIPGRRGPSPKIYMVTADGLSWLKHQDRETKKLLKKLES